VLSGTGDMIIEQSSGGNSTKVLLTSEKEKHGIKIRIHINTISIWTATTEETKSSVLLWTALRKD